MYLQIFTTRNYILFKISAWSLFLRYSQDFANFSLDSLIKYILIEKKSVLHSKDQYTQDTSPSPQKNNVEGSPEHFWYRLNNTDQGGVGGGATMMLNSLGVSPVHNKA